MDNIYQVISFVDGVFHSEGFFEDLNCAISCRDSISERMYYCDRDGSCFINEFAI